jgi:hypothetical protein
LRASWLLGRTVTAAGHPIGLVRDVLLDADGERVVGFEVEGSTGGRWFLPEALATAAPHEGIETESALHLVEDAAFYHRHGRSLASGGPDVDYRLRAPRAAG